jgi:DNA-binding NtrC family response regulator
MPKATAGEPVSQSTSILLLGDGPEAGRLQRRLARHFLMVESSQTVEESRELAQRCRFHLLVLVDPPGGRAAVRGVLGGSGGLPSNTLLIADRSDAETAIDALQDGVSGVLLKPFTTEELVARINAVCGDPAAHPASRSGDSRQVLVGNSGPLRDIRALIEHVAATPATVLIEGEAGTGRKLAARLLHDRGGRPGPFVAVDCRADAEPGLQLDRLNRARETAVDGTLFFEAIHEASPDLQAGLLRSIEENDIYPVSTRIVASATADLAQLVAGQRFRADLYYRLGVIRVGLPPLRERPSDIPLLAAHFASRLSADLSLPFFELRPAELDKLREYAWPGNVQELRDVIEQSLRLGSLPAGALPDRPMRLAGAPDYPLDWTLEQVKRHHMARVLAASDGNKSAAARRLDISRKTLDRKLGTSGRE